MLRLVSRGGEGVAFFAIGALILWLGNDFVWTGAVIDYGSTANRRADPFSPVFKYRRCAF
ncbi:hypothetical protein Poly59_16250 [Rubripirellula reticaptiva]|uniref:Uncharacterized protein n=1 Tax=Rubripirellula reticaptiva TaxID=2528013 RepID=A0A5C6F1U2_9BACT|nr:hypothetical protein Poly59_16250 [Rubripirellula reticaptiva]